MKLFLATRSISCLHDPFPLGDLNDNRNFKDDLLGMLEPGKRVEANLGYNDSAPTVVKCLAYKVLSQRDMSARVCLRHATCKRLFKQWDVLKAAYRHALRENRIVFIEAIIMTQIAFENRQPSFLAECKN